MYKTILAFISGAALGAGIAQAYCKVKYEKLIHEELASVKDELMKGLEKNITSESPSKQVIADNEIDDETNYDDEIDHEEDMDPDNVPISESEYQDIIQQQDYTTYSKEKVVNNESNKEMTPVKSEKKKIIPPYVITPEEFDDHETYDDHSNYEVISLVYYDDGVVAFEDTNRALTPIEINNLIGSESLNHFGQYEEDSVFVRNDTLKCDYEILMSETIYEGIIDQDE